VLDATLRHRFAPLLDAAGGLLARRGVHPIAVTLAGVIVALAAAGAAAAAQWRWALVLWLTSRLLDALDGPIARAGGGATDLGGVLDMASDVVAYAATVVGAAIGNPDAVVACLVLLATYYVNGSVFLLGSLVAERRGRARPDERSLHFTRGLAEGTETVLAHAAMFAVPSVMAPVAWVFAAMVAVTAVQRTLETVRGLRG